MLVLTVSFAPVVESIQAPIHDIGISFSEVKRSKRDADHSPLSCAEIKNALRLALIKCLKVYDNWFNTLVLG
jgi:hypothetical protein